MRQRTPNSYRVEVVGKVCGDLVATRIVLASSVDEAVAIGQDIFFGDYEPRMHMVRACEVA